MSKLKIQHELDLDLWWNGARLKVDRMLARKPELAPHAAKGGEYDGLTLDNWISGFWPGKIGRAHV